jgi:hypothetical protein
VERLALKNQCDQNVPKNFHIAFLVRFVHSGIYEGPGMKLGNMDHFEAATNELAYLKSC